MHSYVLRIHTLICIFDFLAYAITTFFIVIICSDMTVCIYYIYVCSTWKNQHRVIWGRKYPIDSSRICVLFMDPQGSFCTSTAGWPARSALYTLLSHAKTKTKQQPEWKWILFLREFFGLVHIPYSVISFVGWFVIGLSLCLSVCH